MLQVASAYQEALLRTISVSAQEMSRARDYLIERGLTVRYGGGNGRQPILQTLQRGEAVLQVQDWLLADPSLPSSTGREKSDSFANTVAVCVELGLLSDRSLTIESYGNLVVTLAEDRGLLKGLADLETNPFRPDPPIAATLLFQFLRCDFVLQRELASSLTKAAFSFTEDLAVDVSGLLRRVRTKIPITAANRDVVTWLAKQERNASELEASLRGDRSGSKKRRAAPQTLYRPFEDMILPRLELLVDVGLLTKRQPSHYAYEKRPGFSSYVRLLNLGRDGLETDYFHMVAEMSNRQVRAITDPAEVLSHLKNAASRLQGLTGFAPIVETVMLANFSQWALEPWPIVEIADGVMALKKLASEDRPQVRVLADRSLRPRDFALL